MRGCPAPATLHMFLGERGVLQDRQGTRVCGQNWQQHSPPSTPLLKGLSPSPPTEDWERPGTFRSEQTVWGQRQISFKPPCHPSPQGHRVSRVTISTLGMVWSLNTTSCVAIRGKFSMWVLRKRCSSWITALVYGILSLSSDLGAHQSPLGPWLGKGRCGAAVLAVPNPP